MEFGVNEVLRYTRLVKRYSFILSQSGIDWKPEYEQELLDIDAEIAMLRKLMPA